jgi:hypothetical protein
VEVRGVNARSNGVCVESQKREKAEVFVVAKGEVEVKKGGGQCEPIFD